MTAVSEQRLALASWCVPLATMVLAMTVHALSGPRAVPFFISEADDGGLAGTIFTVGLFVAGALNAGYAYHLFRRIHPQQPRVWMAAFGAGLLSSVNLMLLSVLDMYNHLDPHIVTSMLAFGGGIAWVGLAWKAVGTAGHERGQRWRRNGTLMSAAGFASMVGSFQWAANNVNAEGMTTTAFLNEVQHAIVVAAPGEYLLVAGLFVGLASFRFDLAQTSIAPATEERP